MSNDRNDGLQVIVEPTGRIRIVYRDSTLFLVDPSDWIIERVQKVTHQRWIAWDHFSEHGIERFRVHSVVQLADNTCHLVDDQHRALVEVRFVQALPDELTVSAYARFPEVNRLGFSWWGPASEAIFGFGEYGNGPLRHAAQWSTWVEEGPVGLGPLSRWLRWTGRVPLPRGYYSTYAAIPSWLSSLGYGAWITNSDRIDWAIRGARRRMRIWNRQFDLHIVSAPNLSEVIKRRTKALGGPPMPPAWVFFPWIDSVRGQNNAQAVAARLRDESIPASALWIEDWMGSWEDERRFWMRPLRHQVDATLYPDIRSLANQLHAQGFKLLGYFCPEIAHETPLYDEAWEQGHLVCDAHGNPVDVAILGNHHGEPDLTQPTTRQWIQERWFAPLEDLGFDGWMADFGEYLPVEATLADGTNGYESHNRYPLLWQSLHQEFWERVRPDGDYTFFVRSATLGSAHVAPVMWGGDSDTDWDAADGLATVVPQALSAGLLGHAVWGTDIAGYMTFGLTRPATKELYFRWTQVAALLPIMRTHHGTARPRNWHWQRDQHTIQHFARYARLHALLFPYFYTLAAQAHDTGLPIVRPLFLEFQDARYYAVNDVFMLGDRLLVAPVVNPGRRVRMVPFPPGVWTDWWTGFSVRGPTTMRIPATLEHIPLFVREGSLLPLQEGPLNDRGQSRGFMHTPVGDPCFTDLCTHVTILSCGMPPKTGAVVAFPNGRLQVTVCDRPLTGSSSTEPAPPPQTLDHAPLLNMSGMRFVVLPGRERQVAGLHWVWDGQHPLWVTLRQLSNYRAAEQGNEYR